MRFVLEKPKNGGILGSNKVIQFGLSSHFNPLLDDKLSTIWVRTSLKSHPVDAAVKALPPGKATSHQSLKRGEKAVTGKPIHRTPSSKSLWVAKAKVCLNHRDLQPAKQVDTLGVPKGQGLVNWKQTANLTRGWRLLIRPTMHPVINPVESITLKTQNNG